MWSTKDPIGGGDFNSFVKDQVIGKGNNIYVAQIDGQEWFQFIEREGSAFGYLQAQSLDKTECRATWVPPGPQSVSKETGTVFLIRASLLRVMVSLLHDLGRNPSKPLRCKGSSAGM